RARDITRDRVRRVADAQPAELALAGAACRLAGDLGLADHAPRLLEQDGTRGSEGDAAMRAVQQQHAELGLELADLLAHCRLSDVQPLRRAPGVQLLGDGDEVSEMSQFHVSTVPLMRPLVDVNRPHNPIRWTPQ